MSSIIYCLLIEKDGVEENYIGSTIDEYQRMRLHKSSCFNQNSNEYNKKFYQKVREFELEWCDVEIFILERNNIKTKRLLEKIEQKYIDWLKPTCNSQYAYIELNKNETYIQCYYQKHKEYIKERVKLNTEKNKEKVAAYQKQYKEKNKDKIQARKSEYIECTCGKFVTRGHISSHKKSKYHIRHNPPTE